MNGTQATFFTWIVVVAAAYLFISVAIAWIKGK